ALVVPTCVRFCCGEDVLFVDPGGRDDVAASLPPLEQAFSVARMGENRQVGLLHTPASQRLRDERPQPGAWAGSPGRYQAPGGRLDDHQAWLAGESRQGTRQPSKRY